jgi:hypothetical protein
MHVREPLRDRATWRDANGRVHKRYAVRSMGSRGFMVVDIYRNVAMATDFETRESAHEWMQTNGEDLTVLKAGKL